jgi:hypothetical protein
MQGCGETVETGKIKSDGNGTVGALCEAVDQAVYLREITIIGSLFSTDSGRV